MRRRKHRLHQGCWPERCSVSLQGIGMGALHSAVTHRPVKACTGQQGAELNWSRQEVTLVSSHTSSSAQLACWGAGRGVGQLAQRVWHSTLCICASLSHAGPGQCWLLPLWSGLYILSLNIAARQLWAFNCPELLLTFNEGRKWEGK